MPQQSIGPYRIIGKLGEGGMGEVFEAMHETIERRVAIKTLRPEVLGNPETRKKYDELGANWRLMRSGAYQSSSSQCSTNSPSAASHARLRL